MNDPRIMATFSWDDGHPLDMKVAQMFSKFGVTCTFYVPRRNSENLPTMTQSDLLALTKDHFDIHSHTLNHVYLESISPELQWQEITQGKQYVEQSTGLRDHIFCYPGGKYSQATVELVKKAGFDFGRTIDMGFSHAYSSDCFLMPTTSIIAPLSVLQILKHTLKRNAVSRLNKIYKFNRAILKKSWSQIPMQAQSSYHFWGHSWELEKYDLWETVETLLKDLQANNVEIISNREFYERR